MRISSSDPDAARWRVWDCVKHERRMDIGWVDDVSKQYLKIKRWDTLVIKASRIVIYKEHYVILLNPVGKIEDVLAYVLSQLGEVK